jgi:hypothetical protein
LDSQWNTLLSLVVVGAGQNFMPMAGVALAA